MVNTDVVEFTEILKTTLQVYSLEFSDGVLSLWWNVLSEFEFINVHGAFMRLHKGGSGSGYGGQKPTPAMLYAMIEAANPNRPLTGDEAWGIMPMDEYTSSVITNEMSEAMNSAQALLSAGDKIAARMAFKGAYDRITSQNKLQGIKARWFASLGSDVQGRESALKLAVDKGRINSDYAKSLLPAPVNQKLVNAIGQAVLIGAAVSPEMSEEERKLKHDANMSKIRQLFSAKIDVNSHGIK